MTFMNSYKALEKLCNDIYGENHGISIYIEEMTQLPSGSRYVFGWDKDLKQLKHYRWVRNKIVHEPNCQEEDMCNSEDVRWLDNFHRRIMNQTDPLALYYQATKAVRNKPSDTPQHTYYDAQPVSHSKKPKKMSVLGIFSVIALIILFFVIILKYINW